MKKEKLFVTITLGLGLTLALLWIVGSQSLSAVAAPSAGCIESPNTLAAELHVCPSGCTYSSVQAAVDAASDGDVIKVAAGTYSSVEMRPRNDITTTGLVTQVVYISKTVTIQGGYTTTNWTVSDPDANPTTLDAGRQGRVIYITGDISPTIEGLCITGGDATGMGGDGSFFEQDAGGGIYVINAAAAIRNNQVFSNTAEYGGGMYLNSCAGTISENTISENSSSGEGGGVGLNENIALFDGNLINHNTSSWGGGLYLHSSPATLVDNTVTANTSTGRGGGGLFLWWSDAVLTGNRIISNTSPWNTNGGIHVFSSSPTLTNNAIVGNQSGGMQIEGHSDLYLLHNTVADNGTDGIGMYVTHYIDLWGTPMYASVALTNTILVSHSVGISVTGGNTVTVNSVLWHGTPITVSQSTTATVSIHNQRTGDPAFAVDGYHITPASAAMDAGIDAGVTTDIDGHHRPYNSAPDLGADELVATTVPTDTESTLVYTDTQDSATVIQVPGGAVTEGITLVYTPVETSTAPSDFVFAGHTFDLDAYRSGSLLSGFTFSVPVTITLHYADADVAGLDEDSLVLEYWNGSAWGDAACGAYDRHSDENWLAVPICHLSRFALFGEREYLIYLPLVMRN